MQRNHVQAKIQVLAERSARDLDRQVPVGGGQDARIHLYRRCAAEPVDLPLLQRAQQLGLQADVHLADLVQQQRAAVGCLELADAARHGAGEGTLFVAEQFRLQQVVGDGGAVQRDNGTGGAARAAVDVAGQYLLAGAGLTGDQHRGFRPRHLLGAPHRRRHRRIAHDQRVRLAGRRLQDRRDQVGVGRQRQEFARAGADRAHGGLGVVAGAAGDDRDVDALGRQRAHQRADVGQQFAQHQIDPRIEAQAGQCRVDPVGLVEPRAAADRQPCGLAEFARQRADDQDAHGVSPRMGSSSAAQ